MDKRFGISHLNMMVAVLVVLGASLASANDLDSADNTVDFSVVQTVSAPPGVLQSFLTQAGPVQSLDELRQKVLLHAFSATSIGQDIEKNFHDVVVSPRSPAQVKAEDASTNTSLSKKDSSSPTAEAETQDASIKVSFVSLNTAQLQVSNWLQTRVSVARDTLLVGAQQKLAKHLNLKYGVEASRSTHSYIRLNFDF